MRPVSDAFLEAVRGSHTALVRARFTRNYQTGNNPTGTELPLIEGTVTMDATADIRSTLDLTTEGVRPSDGVNRWPTEPTSLLAPYGQEVYVERGIEIGNVREWVGLGYFRIYSPEQSEAPDGPIRISARDRMSGIIDAKMVYPVAFSKNHTIEQVFERLVREVYPLVSIEYDLAASAIALNRDAVVEEDRYGFLKDVARSLGRVCFFDHKGAFVVRAAPDSDTPVYTVNSGPNGVLTSLSRTITREGIYNAVIAEGEAADNRPPVRSVAFDNGPTSPTFWDGSFGKVPVRYSSPMLTTTAQASSAAVALLSQRVGVPYSISFGSVPNPALEVLDPILLAYQDDRPAEKHVIQTLSIGLTEDGTMTGTTRQVSGTVIDVSEDL